MPAVTVRLAADVIKLVVETVIVVAFVVVLQPKAVLVVAVVDHSPVEEFVAAEENVAALAVAVAVVHCPVAAVAAVVASFAPAASFLSSYRYLQRAVVIAALKYWRHYTRQTMSLIDINSLLNASPFVVIFSTILPVRSAFVGAIKEQFYQSSFVVHYSPYHSAIHHLSPEVVMLVAVEVVVGSVLVGIVVVAWQHIHSLSHFAAVLVVYAEFVVAVGVASSTVLLSAAEAAAEVVVEEIEVDVVVVEIVDVVDILE
jgi:hypothetical protein